MRAILWTVGAALLVSGCGLWTNDSVAGGGEEPAPFFAPTVPGVDLTARLATGTATAEERAITWATPRYRPGEYIPDRWVERVCFAQTPLAPADVQEALQEGWFGWALVEVRPTAIRVDGKQVAPLSAGVPADAQMRGTLLSPLFDALKEMADEGKALGEMCPVRPFEGRLLVAADARVPWTTLRSVIYTAGQAQFADFAFIVDGPVVRPKEPSTGDRMVTVVLDSDEPAALIAGGADALPLGDGGLGGALDAALGSRSALGCAVLNPTGSMTTGQVLEAYGWFGEFGVTPVLAGGADGVAPVPDSSPGPAWRVEYGGSVRVQRSRMLPIGGPRPDDDDDAECVDGMPVIRALASPTIGRRPLRPEEEH